MEICLIANMEGIQRRGSLPKSLLVDIRFKTFVTIDAGFLNNSPVS